jgi:outer membrane scaffolding protein for murein synthesis (MipA/OmpV family)
MTQIMDETSSLKNAESDSLSAQEQANISSLDNQAQATENQAKKMEESGSAMMAGAAVSFATSVGVAGASAGQSAEQGEQAEETETSEAHDHDINHGRH